MLNKLRKDSNKNCQCKNRLQFDEKLDPWKKIHTQQEPYFVRIGIQLLIIIIFIIYIYTIWLVWGWGQTWKCCCICSRFRGQRIIGVFSGGVVFFWSSSNLKNCVLQFWINYFQFAIISVLSYFQVVCCPSSGLVLLLHPSRTSHIIHWGDLECYQKWSKEDWTCSKLQQEESFHDKRVQHETHTSLIHHWWISEKYKLNTQNLFKYFMLRNKRLT